MSAPQIDLSRQVKIGEDFALAKESGGTGRADAGTPWTIVQVINLSGSSVARGTLLKYDTSPMGGGGSGTGPGMGVTPTTAVSDRPVGIALEDIANGASGDMAMLGSPVYLLTTGTINDGDLLVPSTTSGRAKAAAASLSEVGFATALSEASGTSSTWAALAGPYQAVGYSFFPGCINLIVGDGVNVISTGVCADLRWPFAGTLTRWTLLADIAGAIVFDIWKDSFANFPPVIADTITASAKPTLTASDDEAESTTLTGWTTAFAEGDIFRFNVDSVATIRRVTLELKYLRT
jgi:hypothetical protein